MADGTAILSVSRADSPAEQIDSGGVPTYYHHDQLGSTRMLTDNTGTESATFTYTPYGAPVGSTGTQTTPFGYSGQYTDPETGLQYLRARYYDPAAAQFLTRDPLLQQTREAYAYTGDEPTNAADPSALAYGAGSLGCDGARGPIQAGLCDDENKARAHAHARRWPRKRPRHRSQPCGASGQYVYASADFRIGNLLLEATPCPGGPGTDNEPPTTPVIPWKPPGGVPVEPSIPPVRIPVAVP